MTALRIQRDAAPKAWLTMRQLLPVRDPDFEYWWKNTGLQLALMLEAAGYTTDKQYEALLFHHQWMVPLLGPRPNPDGTLFWRSNLSEHGAPFELSWKWNTSTSKPNIRYSAEPIGKFAGSAVDPLNQNTSKELLYRLSQSFPSVDLTWASHFFATLYDNNGFKYGQEIAAGAPATSTTFTAPEFLPSGLSFKTYFLPRKIGQTTALLPWDKWEESFEKLDPMNRARTAVNDFMKENNAGKEFYPFLLAVDNVKPAKSRLKFYVGTSRTSFNSVCEVMTLGGRIKRSEEDINELRSFIHSVLGLADDFPDDAEAMSIEKFDETAGDPAELGAKLLEGYGYYFDIAPGGELPNVKFYASMRRHGPTDLGVAQGTMKWMEAHGRGQYCGQFLNMLQRFSPSKSIDTGRGIQAFVSFMFKKNAEFDITTYIRPEEIVLEE